MLQTICFYEYMRLRIVDARHIGEKVVLNLKIEPAGHVEYESRRIDVASECNLLGPARRSIALHDLLTFVIRCKYETHVQATDEYHSRKERYRRRKWQIEECDTEQKRKMDENEYRLNHRFPRESCEEVSPRVRDHAEVHERKREEKDDVLMGEKEAVE